jgi:hypothetical protein
MNFKHLPKDWDPYCWMWAVLDPSARFTWTDEDIVFED